MLKLWHCKIIQHFLVPNELYLLNKQNKELWRQLDGFEYSPELLLQRKKRRLLHHTKFFWCICYLPKTRGKGYKPVQTKNFATSRIRLITGKKKHQLLIKDKWCFIGYLVPKFMSIKQINLLFFGSTWGYAHNG